MELLDDSGGGSGDCTWCLVLSDVLELLVKYDTGDRLARLLQELDLSTGLLSRDEDDLKDEDLEDDAEDGEGMVRLLEVAAEEEDEEDVLSLYLLGLILKKLLLEEGLELPDSSSLDWRPLSRKLEPSIKPDRRMEPEPPPGLQDILKSHDKTHPADSIFGPRSINLSQLCGLLRYLECVN